MIKGALSSTIGLSQRLVNHRLPLPDHLYQSAILCQLFQPYLGINSTISLKRLQHLKAFQLFPIVTKSFIFNDVGVLDPFLNICLVFKKTFKKLYVDTLFLKNCIDLFYGDSNLRNAMVSYPLVASNSALIPELLLWFYSQKCLPKEFSRNMPHIRNRKLKKMIHHEKKNNMNLPPLSYLL